MADQAYQTGGMLPLAPTIIAACDRAAAEIKPYLAVDDRVIALYNKIVSIAHPADDSLQKADTATGRVRLEKATQDAQLEYLRATSPQAAANFEAARASREQRQGR